MTDPQNSRTVNTSRIQLLNTKEIARGEIVLYWMRQSQWGEDNHALEQAIEFANHLKLPVVMLFGLTDSYPEAHLRHYAFMLEGLQKTSQALHQPRNQVLCPARTSSRDRPKGRLKSGDAGV